MILINSTKKFSSSLNCLGGKKKNHDFFFLLLLLGEPQKICPSEIMLQPSTTTTTITTKKKNPLIWLTNCFGDNNLFKFIFCFPNLRLSDTVLLNQASDNFAEHLFICLFFLLALIFYRAFFLADFLTTIPFIQPIDDNNSASKFILSVRFSCRCKQTRLTNQLTSQITN